MSAARYSRLFTSFLSPDDTDARNAQSIGNDTVLMFLRAGDSRLVSDSSHRFSCSALLNNADMLTTVTTVTTGRPLRVGRYATAATRTTGPGPRRAQSVAAAAAAVAVHYNTTAAAATRGCHTITAADDDDIFYTRGAHAQCSTASAAADRAAKATTIIFPPTITGGTVVVGGGFFFQRNGRRKLLGHIGQRSV